MSEVLEILAFRRVDNPDSLQRNIQRLGRFLNLRAIAQQNRRSQPKRVELPRRLQHARLEAFREDDPFRMSLQLLNDTANKSHGALTSPRTAKAQRRKFGLQIIR